MISCFTLVRKKIVAMKLRRFVLLSFVSLFSIALNAQCVNGVNSYPIYNQGAEYVQYLDSIEMEIVRIEYDLIFSEKESFRNLYSDWEYLIFCFMDDGVKSFELTINEYDSENDLWFPVAFAEESEDGMTSIIYQPEESKQYKVNLEIIEFYEGYSAARYGLIYVHD